MRNKVLVAIVLIMSVFWITSCGNLKKTSMGRSGEIIVFADSTDWEAIGDDVADVFAPVVITPQNERLYNLTLKKPEEYIKFNNTKSIIFLASLQTTGFMKEVVDQMLVNQEVRKSVEEGESFYFARDDQWAKNQFVLILVSSNIETLRDKINDNSSVLFSLMHEKMSGFAREELYEKMEQKETEKTLFEKYGFSIRIPVDYHLVSESEEDNFLWIRRWNPQRGVFIHWEDAKNVKELNKEWVVKTRDYLAFQYCDSMTTDSLFLNTNYDIIAGYPALKTEGLWVIDGRNIGGPFINYSFLDKEKKRIFMLDGFVYFPQGEKAHFLRQLDIVLRTFSKNPEAFGIKQK